MRVVTSWMTQNEPPGVKTLFGFWYLASLSMISANNETMPYFGWDQFLGGHISINQSNGGTMEVVLTLKNIYVGDYNIIK